MGVPPGRDGGCAEDGCFSVRDGSCAEDGCSPGETAYELMLNCIDYYCTKTGIINTI